MVSQNKIFMYGAAGISFLGLLIILLSGGGNIFTMIGALFCLIGGIFTVLIIRYGYMIIPIITQRTNTVVMTDNGFEIPPSQDVVIKSSEGVYYASAFLGIKIHESASEKTLDENVAYNEYFERAISNLRYVTKISYMLYVEDIGEKRKSIEAKRAEGQLRLSREREKSEADVLKIDRYEREVDKWNSELNKIIKGVKPMGVVAYAMTSAAGVSKEGAIASVKAQAAELKTVLANALNVEVETLTADEMLRCFEWERFFPITPTDLEDSMI